MNNASLTPLSTDQTESWKQYQETKFKLGEPRPTLIKALDMFEEDKTEPEIALDLGCGVGNDAAYLVNKGWKVTAMDVDAENILAEYLQKKIPENKSQNVTFIRSSFENYAFAEKVKFINASMSLPFCAPSKIHEVMLRIIDAVSVGGRFAGHFFGPNDSWTNDPSMTFLTKDEVKNYFAKDFVIEHFQDKEWDGPSGSGPKHWHVLEIIAKKV